MGCWRISLEEIALASAMDKERQTIFMHIIAWLFHKNTALVTMAVNDPKNSKVGRCISNLCKKKE